jgi:hypothetical protein
VAIALIGTPVTQASQANDLSHTLVAGANRVVVVTVGAESGLTDPPSADYGGVAMVPGGSVEVVGSETESVYIFYLLEASLPADGANTVEASQGGGALVSCSSYSGVAQTAPAEGEGTSGVGALAYNVESPAAGSLFVSHAVVRSANRTCDTTYALGAPDAEIFEGNGQADDNSHSIAYDVAVGSGTIAVVHTWSVGHDSAAVTLAFGPAGAAGSVVPVLMAQYRQRRN